MSALTPDEEAELAALARALFAPEVTPSSEAQARYAALETRKREARYAAPAPAEPEPPLTTAGMVPEPDVRTLAEAPVSDMAAIVAVSSSSAEQRPRSRRHSVKTRVLSAAIGVGLAVLVGGGVAVARNAAAPQPIASGTAVPITIDELPDMGELMSGAIEARVKAGGSLYLVDGIPGVSVVLSSMAENDRCVYVAALENARPNNFMSECSDGYGPIVYDFMDAMLVDGPLPDEDDVGGFKRLIIRDGEMTLWDDPTVRWEDQS